MDHQLDLIFAYDQQLVSVDKYMTPLSNVDLNDRPLLLTVGVKNGIPDDNVVEILLIYVTFWILFI